MIKRRAVSVIVANAVWCLTTSLMGEPPNIMVIMSDDMGYSDIGCYGSAIDTPNLNSLAENGLRFTQFYNTARCWPTRATTSSYTSSRVGSS